MPELALYRNPTIEYVPRVNLQVADKTLATMQQNHLKTIELQGELAAAVNAMDLDESENDYKAGLIDDIEKTVEDSTVNGYAGYALDDIIKKLGDINGNQLLKGKIDANAAHKKYIADTQARTDITQDTKDMFIEQNPYNLNKTDDKGNILEPGTYSWTPKSTPVRDVPLTEIFDQAVKIASPEMSSWDTVIYQNADGTTSTTAGPNTIGYIDSSGKTTKLSKEKLLDAVNAVINSNQEYRASLNQAFEVQKWKLNNGRIPKEAYEAGIVPGVDKSGNPTSLDEYIKASVDPFLNAKMYNYSEVNKKYNPFTSKQLEALSGANAGGGISSLFEYANGSSRNVGGNNISIRDDQFLTDNLVGTIKLAGDLRNRLTLPVEEGGFGIDNSDLGLSSDSIGIPADYSTVQNAVMKSKGVSSVNDLDDETKDFLYKTKSNYLLYAATIDDYNNAISGNDAGAAWRFITPLISTGQDISQFSTSTNPYVKQVVDARANAIHSAFYDDANNKTASWIKMSYDNEDDLNDALANLGGKQSALDSGFRISGNDIILDYKNRNQIENFAQLVAPGKKGHFYREGYGRIDYSGIGSLIRNTALTETYDAVSRNNNIARSHTKSQLYNSFTEATKVLASLPAANTYNEVDNRQHFVTTPSAVPGDTIGSYSLNMILENPDLDKDARTAYSKAKSASEANTYALLQNFGLSNVGIWKYDEATNKYDNVDDLAIEGKTPNYSKALNEKIRIQKVIRQTPKNNIEFDLFFIPAVGWRPGYRIYSGQPEDYEDSNGNTKQTTRKLLENIILDVPDGIGDSGLDYLNNDSYTKGSTDVTSSLFRGTAVTIGKDYSGNYGARYNKDKDAWELTINGKSDENSPLLNTEQVTNYRQAYRAACDELPNIRRIYQTLVQNNPTEDINKLKTAAYIQGLVKNHPQVNWNAVDPSILEYILFEY